MSAWMVWILLAVILAAGEVMTLSFFLAPFAGGALVAALVELAGAGSIVALIAFIVSSGLLLGFVGPLAPRPQRLPDPPGPGGARRPHGGRHGARRRGRGDGQARG
jgi:membrane protein implicated in regulation of membrane protease activity